MAYLPRSARPSKDTAPEVALFRNDPPLAASAARMPLNPLYAGLAQRLGQRDNLGAAEVTVLDLEETEGPMRLAPFIGG